MSTSLPKVASSNAITAVKLAARALRESKKVDPRLRYVVIYPSYDSCHPGMAFSLLGNKQAEQVFQQISEIVQRNILKMCLDKFEPIHLKSIEDRSIAAFATSHATMAKLASQKPELIKFIKAAGGIGTGFINSLVFSGAMTFENALDLVIRGSSAMDRASQIVPSGRLKVQIIPATRKRIVTQAAIEYCIKQGVPEEVAVCSIAKQVVPHVWELAGHKEAIDFIEREGTRLFGFRRISRVKNEIATHTPLMEPASLFLKGYIEDRLLQDPQYLIDPVTCSVYSATATCRLQHVKLIRKDLYQFPTRPIGLQQLFECLYKRPRSLAMPNTLILWDRKLQADLTFNNRLAAISSKLVN